MKTAIVTGVPGQDASYLCELLLDKGYKVVGISRRSTRENNNMENCIGDVNYQDVIMDITDVSGMRNIIGDYKPERFFNLAAMSQVAQSFKEPLSTLMIDGYAVVGILESIRTVASTCRYYNASTSEMLGKEGNIIFDDKGERIGMVQDMETRFNPMSPYAAAKVYSHHMTQMYRNAYNLHASCGILHNHESCRRGKDFVTRKITYNVARIKYGLQDKIKMGNLDTYRDFGNAKDYVQAMYLMLENDTPDDYMICTGKATSIKEILIYVCSLAGLYWEDIYERDERFIRPSDVPFLLGDNSKIKRVLGWEPTYTWQETLKEMYLNDYDLVAKEKSLL